MGKGYSILCLDLCLQLGQMLCNLRVDGSLCFLCVFSYTSLGIAVQGVGGEGSIGIFMTMCYQCHLLLF